MKFIKRTAEKDISTYTISKLHVKSDYDYLIELDNYTSLIAKATTKGYEISSYDRTLEYTIESINNEIELQSLLVFIENQYFTNSNKIIYCYTLIYININI